MALASGCTGPCLDELTPNGFPPPTPQAFLTLSYVSVICLLLLISASLVQVGIYRRTPAQLLQRKSFMVSCGVSIGALVLAVAGRIAYEPYGQMGMLPHADYSDWAQHLSPAALTQMGEMISWYSIAVLLVMLATAVLLCMLLLQACIRWMFHPRLRV